MWVRARQGPNLADLVAEPGTTRALGDADLIDVLGSAFAAADGDPRTAWTAPQSVVQHQARAHADAEAAEPTEVAALRLTPSTSALPAHPTLVAVDLGDGPQVAPDGGPDAGAQTLALKPQVTDTVKLSMLDWDDVIDRTALGFDQFKPPGLAEVAALRPRRHTDRRRRRRPQPSPHHRIALRPGPIIGVAGQFVQTSVHTTVGALLDGEPIAAQPCETRTARPACRPAGAADQPRRGVRRRRCPADGPAGRRNCAGGQRLPPQTGAWGADRREVDVTASARARVLVVPESVNPGWVARRPTASR